MNKNTESIRIDAFNLLRKSSDKKILLSSTNDATTLIEKAYKLVYCHDTGQALIPEPIPSVISYRRALLALRKDNLSQSELEEIDEWILKAAKQDCLGPWPRIYRLVVLSRLGETAKRFDDAVKRAMESVKTYLLQHEELSSDISERDYYRLQNELFNALEAVVLQAGASYESLEGVGGERWQARLSSDSGFGDIEAEFEPWVIVSPEALSVQVRMPISLAVKEIDERCSEATKQDQLSYFFKFSGSSCEGLTSNGRSNRSGKIKPLIVLAFFLSRPTGEEFTKSKAKLADIKALQDGNIDTILSRDLKQVLIELFDFETDLAPKELIASLKEGKPYIAGALPVSAIPSF